MKTRIMLALIMLGSTLGSYAQDPESNPARQEKVRAMKIAFITEKMALTPEEAEKFWPVYNEYNMEAEKINKDSRGGAKGRNKPLDAYDNLSDKEIEALIDKSFKNDQEALDLKKKYYGKYKSVLPVKKIAKLYDAEEQFKRELIQKLKERKAGKPGAGQGRN